MPNDSPRPSETSYSSSPLELERARRAVLACHARMGHPLGSEDLADLVQEVAIAAWRNAHKLRSSSSRPAWVYGIARLEILKELRSRGRREVTLGHLSNDPTLDGEALSAGAVERGTTHSGCLREEIAVCLAKAGSTVAMIVNSRGLNGWSFRRISLELGRPESALKSRYYRALPALRAQLARLRRRHL